MPFLKKRSTDDAACFASYCEPYLLRAEFSRRTPYRPIRISTYRSQDKLQRELQSTWRVVRVRYDDFPESGTLNRVRCGRVILIVSHKVARCIRQVESLRAKLQLNAFRQSEVLEERKIKMPEGRTIQAVTRCVSDCPERRNDKSAWVKPLVDAGTGPCRRSDLVWAGWSATDSVKDRIAKAGEIVGYAERATGIPNENRIGLPSRKRHFLSSGEVLAKWQLISNGANKSMAEIKVAVAGLKLMDGEWICISKALLALIAESRGIVDGVRVSIVGGYCESVAVAALERCLQRVVAGAA
jgi:hypothetical protein